jgi:hypothetical protein
VRLDTEQIVPGSRSGPHLVVLHQNRINEHTQLSCMTKGRHASTGFVNRSH